MTEYSKIMEVMYFSAIKMGRIYQNPPIEFSLNSPPKHPEERQEVFTFTLWKDLACFKYKYARLVMTYIMSLTFLSLVLL